jgi:hypothetical protein
MFMTKPNAEKKRGRSPTPTNPSYSIYVPPPKLIIVDNHYNHNNVASADKIPTFEEWGNLSKSASRMWKERGFYAYNGRIEMDPRSPKCWFINQEDYVDSDYENDDGGEPTYSPTSPKYNNHDVHGNDHDEEEEEEKQREHSYRPRTPEGSPSPVPNYAPNEDDDNYSPPASPTFSYHPPQYANVLNFKGIGSEPTYSRTFKDASTSPMPEEPKKTFKDASTSPMMIMPEFEEEEEKQSDNSHDHDHDHHMVESSQTEHHYDEEQKTMEKEEASDKETATMLSKDDDDEEPKRKAPRRALALSAVRTSSRLAASSNQNKIPSANNDNNNKKPSANNDNNNNKKRQRRG